VTESPAIYNVDLPDFQGPLDLLLNLIEQEELDITRISLAYVTDQYLAYLNILREIDPDELTDFLVVAAKLILIKSEALLPRPPASMLDEAEEDVGNELARQLLAYKQYKTIAAQLQAIEATGKRNFVRLAPPLKIEPKLVPGEISLEALLQAARSALAIKPADPMVDEVISRQVVTIGQQMAYIRQELGAQRLVNLQEVLARSHSRIEVIVTLLAVLELIKRHVIQVEQAELFGDIIIRKNERVPELSESEWAELTGLIEVS
jgi:segregation and condensation protein A